MFSHTFAHVFHIVFHNDHHFPIVFPSFSEIFLQFSMDSPFKSSLRTPWLSTPGCWATSWHLGPLAWPGPGVLTAFRDLVHGVPAADVSNDLWDPCMYAMIMVTYGNIYHQYIPQFCLHQSTMLHGSFMGDSNVGKHTSKHSAVIAVEVWLAVCKKPGIVWAESNAIEQPCHEWYHWRKTIIVLSMCW